MDKLGQAFFVSKQIPILKPTLVKAPAYSTPIKAMQNGAMLCKPYDGRSIKFSTAFYVFIFYLQ